MKIAVYGRQFNDTSALPFIQQVFDSLYQHGVEIYVHHQLNQYLAGKINTVPYHVLNADDQIKGLIDLFITLGGDGTLLDMVSVISDSGVPVIGINFARLGFLGGVK